MKREVLLLAGVGLISLLALLLSPLVRAICWDALVHPRYRCTWEKCGSQVRELKAGVDYPRED